MTIFELSQEEFMRLPILGFVMLFGILVGSFLNVLIYRIPKKEEFVKTSSHCMSCNHQLAWYDNIPLFSWLFLKGKCRYCKAKISAQYPIIEFLNGVMWLGIFLIHGVNIDSLLISLMTSGLIALSVIDWRTYEIANGFHVYFTILALCRIAMNYTNWSNYVIGFFCVSIPLLILYLASGGNAIGGGDVKLMAACGLFLGWKNTILALIVGCVVGSVIHLIRMKVSEAGKVLAMGPYLAFGILFATLFGEQIINWYLSVFFGIY